MAYVVTLFQSTWGSKTGFITLFKSSCQNQFHVWLHEATSTFAWPMVQPELLLGWQRSTAWEQTHCIVYCWLLDHTLAADMLLVSYLGDHIAWMADPPPQPLLVLATFLWEVACWDSSGQWHISRSQVLNGASSWGSFSLPTKKGPSLPESFLLFLLRPKCLKTQLS